MSNHSFTLTLCTNQINREAAADDQDCCWQEEKINGFRRHWRRHCFLGMPSCSSPGAAYITYCLRCPLLLPATLRESFASPLSFRSSPLDFWQAIPMAKDDDLSNCLQSLWKISKEITKLIPSSDGPNFINDLATCRRRVGGGVSNCLLWS